MSVKRWAMSVGLLVASSGTGALAAAPEPPAGASSCSGCHAAGAKVDTAVPRLSGRSAAEIVTQMQAFKSRQKPSTVMDRIAKGFTDAEVQAIADWYARQK
jgi:cytochrome c553